MSESGGASVGIGGPTSASWREEALARVEGLAFLHASVSALPAGDVADSSFRRHLEAAREAAEGQRSMWERFSGTSFERALTNLDVAEVDLLRRAPPPVLEGALPSVQAHVNRFLAKDDPRREAIDALIRPPGEHFTAHQRELLLNGLSAANTQRRRNLARVRSFRSMLRGGILAACLLTVAMGLLGLLWPAANPLCFTPQHGKEGFVLACPQTMTALGDADPSAGIDTQIAAAVKPGDIALIEFLGLLGAGLSVVAVLRNLKKGTSTPYNIPFSLAILKLPTGALTAVAGLMLMRADFVPGLSALDTSAQILGWALVFGIAQQLVTRLADSRADGLLESVGGRGAAGDRPMKVPS